MVEKPTTVGGIVKLRLTAVSDPQHGLFTAGSSPVSWESIDELFVNLTVPFSEPCCFARRLQDRESDTGYDTGRRAPGGGIVKLPTSARFSPWALSARVSVSRHT